MGFLGDILKKAGLSDSGSGANAQSGGNPFKFTTSFRPVRLKARNENSTELMIKLKNTSGGEKLCSVSVQLPNQLGFDSVGLHKTKELRMGNLLPGAQKEAIVSIWATSQTPAGTYCLNVVADTHYRDYSHVINSARKSVELRVV